MGKKILVLTGSPRKNGNSDLMAEAFVKGAKAAGHEVQSFSAGRSEIKGCTACNACATQKSCIHRDDFDKLAPMMLWADALVLATPMYWYSFPTQIKAALDKMYSFLAGGISIKIKETMLLCCAETEDSSEFAGILSSYEIIAKYLNWEDKGHLLVPNVNLVGDIRKTNALAKAEEMGKQF
jgi:multimeric flavodoxin WrbA